MPAGDWLEAMNLEQLTDEAHRLCVRLEARASEPYFTPGGRAHDLINEIGAATHFARLRRIRVKAIDRHNRRLAALEQRIAEQLEVPHA